MIAAGATLVLLSACTMGDDDDDAGDSGELDDSGGTADVRPVLLSADASCYLHDVGEQYWQWELLAEASDPQGVDTLATTATVDAVIATGDVVASPTIVRYAGSPEFFGGFKESDFGMLCGDAQRYTFHFRVHDQDGHDSEVIEVVGRRQ
jgi:hypothetical protein